MYVLQFSLLGLNSSPRTSRILELLVQVSVFIYIYIYIYIVLNQGVE